MKAQGTGKVSIQEDWEKYDCLAKRQIIRKLMPCRVNITVFANNPHIPQVDVQARPAKSGDAVGQSRQDVPPMNLEPACESDQAGTSNKHAEPTSSSESPEDMSEQVSKRNGEDADSQIPMEQTQPAKPGDRFLALLREEQIMLRRAHQNLCHPSPSKLSAMLRSQGARSDLTQAVFDMPCDVCASKQLPKIARPCTVKLELDFNDKVFIDGVTWTNNQGKSFHFYHLIDQATNCHTAVPAPNRSAENAVQSVLDAWFQWAGPPNMLVTDFATEFLSEHFSNFLQRFDVKSTTVAPNAHWQNGRCERHGHVLQEMLSKIDMEQPISTYHEMQMALVQCTQAKNMLSIRRGYSPEVLVFGKSSRIPGSLTSSDNDTSLASADRDDAHGIAFRKSLAPERESQSGISSSR